MSATVSLTNRPVVEGEAWINGKRANARYAPNVSESGFRLKNETGFWSGPHFDFQLEIGEFASFLDTAAEGTAQLQLTRTQLGRVDECNGYAAADVGSHSRPIQALSLRVSHSGFATRFEFEGETGFVDPTTARGSDLSHEKYPYWVFHVWLVVPDKDIHEYFRTPDWRKAMENYVRRHQAERLPEAGAD